MNNQMFQQGILIEMDQTIQFNIVLEVRTQIKFYFSVNFIVFSRSDRGLQFSYSFLYHAKVGQNMLLKMAP